MPILTIFIFFLSLFSGFAQDGYIDGYMDGSPELAYWKIGSGSEIVIVLHGGPGVTHNYLRPEWDSLAKVAQVVYYDQRGCGKSQTADCYSWREQVADLKRLITQLADGRKVILAGSSWGSTLGLLYAYSHPEDVKGIVLSGNVEWTGKGRPKQDCSLLIPKYADGVIYGHPFPTRGTLEFTFSKGERKLEKHAYLQHMVKVSMEDAPTLEELKRIHVPILMFEGKNCELAVFVKDHTYRYKGILPKLEIFTIKQACHDPWYTHTEAFFMKSIDYIRKL